MEVLLLIAIGLLIYIINVLRKLTLTIKDQAPLLKYPPYTGTIVKYELTSFIRAFSSHDGYNDDNSAIEPALRGVAYSYARVTRKYEEENSLIYEIEYWK